MRRLVVATALVAAAACVGTSDLSGGGDDPAHGGDAGADASPATDATAPVVWHDTNERSHWTLFDLTSLSPAWLAETPDVRGAVFDGHYLTLATSPVNPQGPPRGLIARYDTTAAFDVFASWSTFDTGLLEPDASFVRWGGAAFDGKALVLASITGTIAARHAIAEPFGAPSGWSLFDLAAVMPNAFTSKSALFDGKRYVYTCGSRVLRYDTNAPFAQPGSWEGIDLEKRFPNNISDPFGACAFDGRYLYLAAYGLDFLPRYDTQAPIAASSSWTSHAFPQAYGVTAPVFDGRYLYLAAGDVQRYDTQAGFDDPAAWTTFATSGLVGGAGFAPAVFDGRFVDCLGRDANGDDLLARYDTTASFGAPTSWSVFDTKTLDSAAKSFGTAAVDGRHLYLLPTDGRFAARFDLRD
jgi:hypothetical protein